MSRLWQPEELKKCLKSPKEISEIKNKKLAEFYSNQNQIIRSLIEPFEQEPLNSSFAVYGSLMANIMLFSIQTSVSMMTGSHSILGIAMDAFMDLLSGVILAVTNYLSKKEDVLRYPTGKKRYQTVGVMLFAGIMSVCSVFLIFQGINRLLLIQKYELKLHALILVIFGIFVKLLLWIYCSQSKDPSALTLASDHRNDVCLNSFALIMAYLASGESNFYYVDPVGGLIIAMIVFCSWIKKVFENIALIVGKTASLNVLKKLTYISVMHDERIQQIETCRAYHLGQNVFAEIDIVLPPEMSLRESHDIGETLQYKIESLSMVSRAFVHCDYEFSHRPEH